MKEKLRQEPAFPNDVKNDQEETMLREGLLKHGMSKRFYAACAAMNGIISNSNLRDCLLSDSKSLFLNPDKISPEGYLVKNAYKYADELLEQENQT